MKDLLPAEEDQSRENESQWVDHGPSRTKSCPKPPPSLYDEQNKRLMCSASQSPRSTDDICNKKTTLITRNRNNNDICNKKIKKQKIKIKIFVQTYIHRKLSKRIKIPVHRERKVSIDDPAGIELVVP